MTMATVVTAMNSIVGSRYGRPTAAAWSAVLAVYAVGLPHAGGETPPD